MSDKKDFTTSSLEKYIEYTSSLDLNLIASSTFNDLYDSLLKSSNDCIDEIKTNLLKLKGDKHKDYLEPIRRELKLKFNYKKNHNILDPYLEKYDLLIDDFPFSDNNKIRQILSKNVSDGKPLVIDGSILDVDLIKDIHFDFFCFAIIVETNKILEFIDDNLSEDGIFRSINSKKMFEKLLKFLNIEDHITRGNQAKLHGIFQTPSSKKAIFKASTGLKEYLVYINSVFGSNFNTKSISNGSNYERTINDWIKEQNL